MSVLNFGRFFLKIRFPRARGFEVWALNIVLTMSFSRQAWAYELKLDYKNCDVYWVR